jgi:cyclophilin family peptidyl-prolyl cis-trans isomerase
MKFPTQFFCLFSFLCVAQVGFAAAPVSPSNGGASIVERNTLQITWQDNSNNEDAFAVYQYVNNAPANYLGAVGINLTSATITGFSGGESVQYAIYAYSEADGFSAGNAVTPLVTFPAESTPDIVTRFGHEATVGEAFSAELYTDYYDFQTSASITGLPEGVTFTEATRTLSFMPSEPGNFSINLEVNYSDGFTLTATIPIRILPAASGPVESVTVPGLDYYPNAGVQTLDLNTYFEDPDCSRAVRMTYGLGVMDIILYEAATPATVANFLAYVNDTEQSTYDGAIIHRSISNFVIQGGGYRSIGGNAFESVTDLAPVVNEPGLENVRGTLSMAKLGGNPNSATNEWFVSLEDNRSNLDFQNGGFTVFGRVAGNGMSVIDSIAALQTGSYNNITVDSISRPELLSAIPVDATPVLGILDPDTLVVINSAVEISPLTYSIASNSDTAVAVANINGTTLEITPLAVGVSTLRLQVTDLDNNVIERDVSVVVDWTYADWIEASGATVDTGAFEDADGDQLSNFLEYALFGDLESLDVSLAVGSQVEFDGQFYPGQMSPFFLAIEFASRRGLGDAIVYVEAVNDLSEDGQWSEIWNSTLGDEDSQVFSATQNSESIDWVIRDNQSIGDTDSRFLRVRVAPSED